MYFSLVFDQTYHHEMLDQTQYFRQKENLEIAKSGNPNDHTIFRVLAQRVTGLNERRVGGWGRMVGAGS